MMDRYSPRLTTGIALLLLAASLLGGCVFAVGTGGGKDKDHDHHKHVRHDRRVPPYAVLVAFGREMHFAAPRVGTVYLVNAETGELNVVTMLEAGEAFEVDRHHVTYGGEQYRDMHWRLAFDEHELYFAPLDWDGPRQRASKPEAEEATTVE